jgi:preprotein translocase subunit SecE
MNTVITYLNDVKKELKQTTFPSKDYTFYYTTFVIAFAVLMSVYFAVLDLGFGELLKKYLEIFVK